MSRQCPEGSEYSEQELQKTQLVQKLLAGLNETQLQAVTHGRGPAFILAGPGSGKTTVIVKRILYLIQIQKIPPEEILVVTFTKEAALSMQQRFKELADHVNGETCVSLPVNFGTFHSIFYHILREAHYSGAGNILSTSQKKELLLEILKKRAIDKEGHYEMDSLKIQADEYLAAIGFYKNTYDQEKAIRLLQPELKEDFPMIIQAFQVGCRREGGLDFDDMVFECRNLLLRDGEIRAYWQKRFSYILVDEFQDINPMQYEVIKLLGEMHKNLFAVGDEDQAIYGFRGSDPDCVRQFVKEYNAKQILLNANYRSTSEIVNLAERVIAENKNRLLQNKESYAAGTNAGLQNSIKFTGFMSKQQELSYLAEKLKTAYGENKICNSANDTKQGEEWEEKQEHWGILFRTNRSMQGLAVLLAREGIPFVMKENAPNPYEHFIVKDIMAYLKLAAGENRRELFLRIMNKPVRYISRECAGESSQIDLERISGQNAKADSELSKLKQQLIRMKGMPLSLAIQYICKAVGYENYIRTQKSAGDHLEEWLEILEFCKADAGNYLNVTEWEAAQKSFGRQMGEQKRQFTKTEENTGISLMTVHASKGLEFDYVCIPDCNEKTYPHGKMPDTDAVEEERRIFYVGITRAKKCLELLYVTGSKERPRPVSRFLNPVIHQLSRQTHNCPDTHQTRQ